MACAIRPTPTTRESSTPRSAARPTRWPTSSGSRSRPSFPACGKGGPPADAAPAGRRAGGGKGEPQALRVGGSFQGDVRPTALSTTPSAGRGPPLPLAAASGKGSAEALWLQLPVEELQRRQRAV